MFFFFQGKFGIKNKNKCVCFHKRVLEVHFNSLLFEKSILGSSELLNLSLKTGKKGVFFPFELNSGR